ncbi:zinc-binding alcohol dehydrogenase family protein [Micromonospora sediminicola]|uniref:zinc-binding alcohol dehydrogenase family protein n=1 Tax=Micromonospora sediminicola TaxID=946078 RepID=UPI0037B5A940
MRPIWHHPCATAVGASARAAAVPEPRAHQVLVRVEAVGVRRIDVVLPAGDVGIWPVSSAGSVPGDVVGQVIAVGAQVTGVRAGCRVVGEARGGVAEFALIDSRWLAHVPQGVDPAPATCLASNAPTALRMLREAKVRAGERVLVLSAAGAVGHLLVQLSEIAGADTLAVAATEMQVNFAEMLGARVVADSSQPDWLRTARAAAPSGVDVLVDATGAALDESVVDLLAADGRLVTCLPAYGRAASFPRLVGCQTSVRVSLAQWRSGHPVGARAEIREVTRLWRAGTLLSAVYCRLPFTRLRFAQRIVASGVSTGSVVLFP